MIHISIVVSTVSRTIENTLHRVDTEFATEAEAKAWRDRLDQWIVALPDPLTAGQPREPVDRATQLALELPAILGGRDPGLFGRWYVDPEGEAAIVDRRPYDWTRLDVAA